MASAPPTPGPEPRTRTQRFLLMAIVLAGFLVLATGLLLFVISRDDPRGIAGTVLSNTIGGPFRLIDQNGRPFTDADLRGKWHLVFFGYTHCPDVCPTTLNELSLAHDRLGKERDQVGIVMITVDPQRDTQETLKSYIASFDAPVTALTGTEEQVAEAARAYRVYSARRAKEDGNYDMDHSAVIYVMDPQGRLTATFTPDSGADAIAERMRKLLS
ncbi:MAG: SCO family protein [Alphaproteobacteria bacterium]